MKGNVKPTLTSKSYLKAVEDALSKAQSQQ